MVGETRVSRGWDEERRRSTPWILFEDSKRKPVLGMLTKKLIDHQRDTERDKETERETETPMSSECVLPY